ncbi:MAG: DNA translocase FtsK [Coprothermobacterota bacterium]|nr:DNA translocase FtsK [Coprothermobacterota bacterium]
MATPSPARRKVNKSGGSKRRDPHQQERALVWVMLAILGIVAIAVLAYYLPRVTAFFWGALAWDLPLFFFFLLAGFLLWRNLQKGRLRFLFAFGLGSLLVLMIVGIISRGWWVVGIFNTLGWIAYLLMCFLLLACFSTLFWPGLLGWWKTRQKRVKACKEGEIVVSSIEAPSLKDTPEVKAKPHRPKISSTLERKAPLERASKTSSTSLVPPTYRLPPFELLRKPVQENPKISRRETRNVAQILEDKLNSFGIGTHVVNIEVGPAITRYELQLDPGVKVSRILSLSDDIALTLAATGVRIEAPVPGKSVLGIEVPSEKISTVYLREIVESEVFQKRTFRIPLTLGKDISGHPIVGELREMPHLLVAGATGSGKSVCINSILSGILYHSTPDEVRLVLIDPKRVELYNYRELPHLLYPVVMDVKQAGAVLKEIVSDMESRLVKFSEIGARDIEAYNLKLKEQDLGESLPYYVVVIDELNDLMMIAPADVEKYIIRLAQLARATGIHLIVATQRPSTDVITGIIKANIPSRIAFAVASQMDSRVILDMNGAEKLLGRGDMLFYPVNYPKPVRLQGAFICEEEIDQVVAFWKEQNQDNPLRPLPILQAEGKDWEEEEDDPLFEEAVQWVMQAGEGSASMLQRKMKVGYARAGRLIDLMERRGIVGPANGSKPRQILRHTDQSSLKF